MKKIILSAIGAVTLIIAACIGSSFTIAKTGSGSREIEFKIENNTSSEFDYCVNGGHNYINAGSTKDFDYSEGQEFYYIDNDNCGNLWFKVTSDMAGKEFKLTDMK